MKRADVFTRLKIVLNELEIVYQPKKYFNMSTSKLKILIVGYEEQLEETEECQDYRMYRTI